MLDDYRSRLVAVCFMLAACAGSTDPTHGDPWVGSWNLVTVNGLPVPASIGTTVIVHRSLLVLSSTLGPNDVSGDDAWTDSTLSYAACPAGTAPGSLCDDSGGFIGTWVANGATLTAGTNNPLGHAPGTIIFVKQNDGTLLRTDGGLTEVYSR